MRINLYLKIILALSVFTGNSTLSAQIYTAGNGSIIVFGEIPDKATSFTITTPRIDHNTYQWPSGAKDFIRSYRTAESIITGPASLTDEDLQRIWGKLGEMTSLAPSVQFHPTMLLALGQAAYIPGEKHLASCTVSLRIPKSPDQTKTIEWRDNTNLAGANIKAEKIKDDGQHIQLKFLFPNDSWIKGARVFKKPVGASEEKEIFPIVFSSTLSDRVEMNIRDTLNQVGEFLYTIQPYDYFGNAFSPLDPVYAHNYNQQSAPAIKNFSCEAMEGSKAIRLSWNCTIKARVRGFKVFRGMESDGPFVSVADLPFTDSVFIDHVEGVMQNFYYYIQILDQMGPGGKSIIRFVTPLVTEKPQPPMDLIASPVKEGVLLTWPTQDGLFHTRGYYVYRRDKDTSIWIQASEFIPRTERVMTYTDTSRILEAQNEYTYRIRSESTSYVLSDPSITATSRPGKPREVITPEDLSFRHMDNGQLMLYWSDQRVYDPYIREYHIYMADSNGNPGQEAPGSPVDVNQNFWIKPDSLIWKGDYFMRTEDAWGNLSLFSRSVSPNKNAAVSPPGIILVHPTPNGYKLSWGLPEKEEVQSIQLYEVNEQEESILVKSMTPLTGTFDIPKLKDGQSRSFYLSYKTIDGQESAAGEMVIVFGH